MIGEKMGRKAKSKSTPVSSSISNLFTILSLTYLGKIILYAFVALIIIVITASIVGNDFDRFFKALGVEVLIVTLIGWILYLLLRKD